MQTSGGGAQVPWYAQLSLQTPLTASPDPITGIGPDAQRCDRRAVFRRVDDRRAKHRDERLRSAGVLRRARYAELQYLFDPGFATASSDYTSGSTVYVSATGLNPAHFYSFGFVNTSGNGLPCVFAIPAGSQNFSNGTCFVQGATGILPTTQTLTGQYATPANGNNAVGTQTVQLYDATTNDLISTQQYLAEPVDGDVEPAHPVQRRDHRHEPERHLRHRRHHAATPGAVGARPGAIGAGADVPGERRRQRPRLPHDDQQRQRRRAQLDDDRHDPGSGRRRRSRCRSSSPRPARRPGRKSSRSRSTPRTSRRSARRRRRSRRTSTPRSCTTSPPARSSARSRSASSRTPGQFQWTNPAGAYVNANPASAATNVTTTLRNDGGTLYGAGTPTRSSRSRSTTTPATS